MSQSIFGDPAPQVNSQSGGFGGATQVQTGGGLGQTIDVQAQPQPLPKRGRPAKAPMPALTQDTPPPPVQESPGQPMKPLTAGQPLPDALPARAPAPIVAKRGRPAVTKPAEAKVSKVSAIISPAVAHTISHLQGMVIEAVINKKYTDAVQMLKAAGVL